MKDGFLNVHFKVTKKTIFATSLQNIHNNYNQYLVRTKMLDSAR